MSKKPLLKSDPKRNKSAARQPRAGMQTSLDQILAQVDSVDNLEHLLSYVTHLSRWSTMRNESRHHAYISQLRRVIRVVAECQVELQKQPVYKIFTLLSDLEQRMSSSLEDNLMSQLLKLLAAEVDQHLSPVPSLAVMKGMSEALQAMCGSEYHDDDTGETICFGHLGESALWPNRKGVIARREQEERLADVLNDAVRRTFSNKMEEVRKLGDGGVILQLWDFIFLHTMDNGKLGFLDTPHILAPCYQPEMSCLHWTAMGPVLDILLEREAMTNKNLAVDWPEHRFKLTAVRTVILPRFNDQLSALLSLLESQVKEVDDLKSKILAIGVSVAITGGQLMTSLAFRYMQHEAAQASGDNSSTLAVQ